MDYHSDHSRRAAVIAASRPTCVSVSTRGDIVARAKRTDRAEARRRYRAYLDQTAAEGAEGADSETDVATGSPPPAKASRSAASTPVVRPGQKLGMVAALKGATRPVHYVDDIRYAPTLITRTNAIWVPALFSIAALAFGLTRTDYNDGSIQVLLNFALPVTPLVQPMIAGFLAPRATWLAGILASVISGVCFEVLFIYYTSGHLAHLPTSQAINADQYLPLTIQVFATALTFGALLGAGSGWYKRFLTLASPASPSKPRSGSKPAARRSAARR
jgi:hypothetical protein